MVPTTIRERSYPLLLEESEAQLSGRARFFPVLLPSANMSSAGVVTSEDTEFEERGPVCPPSAQTDTFPDGVVCR